MPHAPVVAVLHTMSLAYSRETLRGVREYVRHHTHWRVHTIEATRGELQRLHQIGLNQINGVIGMFYEAEDEARLGLPGIPTINMSSRSNECTLPRVIPDNEAVGRAAAEYLLSRGLRHFAFAGIAGHLYSNQRAAGFQAGVALGMEQARGQQGGCAEIHLWERQGGEGDGPRFEAWLRGLPRPIGLLAATDAVGAEAIDWCLALGLRVPQDVAIIGVDNDETICEAAGVPLASVAVNAAKVGYEAAALLARLMEGEPPPPPEQPLLIPPLGVIVRDSADVVAGADEELTEIMRYIEQHACDPISIEDVVVHGTLSRRSLERRFREAFGRTVHDEIRRVQFERAKHLLASADMKLPSLARCCGFSDARYFTRQFRQAFGETPSQYRGRFRNA